MSWNIIQQTQKALDYLSSVIEGLAKIWAIIRVVIILGLVLFTIVTNLHAKIDKKCEDMAYEEFTTIDFVVCYHINCGGGCYP